MLKSQGIGDLSEPLSRLEFAVKWAVISFTGVLFAEVLAIPCLEYLGGHTCGDCIWWFLGPMIFLPLGLLLFLLIFLLTLCTLASLSVAKEVVRWVVGCQLVVVGIAALPFLCHLEPSPFMRGFRDRIVQRVSLDDLRTIRQTALRSAPLATTWDRHEVWREFANGELSGEVKTDSGFQQRWRDLCKQTKVEALVGRGRVYFNLDDDQLSLIWGGALVGHWGIQIGEGHVVHYDDALTKVRLSEDIILFYEE